jgi:hypothetical protein
MQTDTLALYGAVVATLSIAWQVFTWWHKGAKLRMPCRT